MQGLLVAFWINMDIHIVEEESSIRWKKTTDNTIQTLKYSGQQGLVL